MYLLTETGLRANHGNFWWSAQIALFLLFVVCVVSLIRMRKTRPLWRAWVCMSVFVLHVGSGFYFYVYQFSVPIY
jgi:hypothetical protein